jgi:hypothetical protein
MASPTVIIDDPDRGGSDAGAWKTAIAHTPHLAAQLAQAKPVRIGIDFGRDISGSCADGLAPPAFVRAGGAALRSPQATLVASPDRGRA